MHISATMHKELPLDQNLEV